jgi:prepilin peptidase CpaA
MTITALAALVGSLCFSVTMVRASVMDLARMKISNELVLLLLAAYAALAPLAGMGVVEISLSAAVAFALLVLMFVFFALGWIGGGDVKLAAVIALWLGADHVFAFVIYTALFGGVLTLAVLQFRSMPLPLRRFSSPWMTRLHGAGGEIPYGVALASAGLFVFTETRWIATLS